jgi:PilZ domain
VSTPPGRDRRRHVRVEGVWPVTAHGVEHTGMIRPFAATMLNISVSGILLEAAVTANLWTDKPLTIDLPGGVGSALATVRHFVEYADEEAQSISRWGIELRDLTVHQRACWGRFVYTAANASGHELARRSVRLTTPRRGRQG